MFSITELFNGSGPLGQVPMIEIWIVAMLGLMAAFLYDYSNSTFRKNALPNRLYRDLPEQCLKLFIGTVGVVKDCHRSFNLDICRDECVCDSRNISEPSFGEDHNLFSAISLSAIAGETGHALKRNWMEYDNAKGVCLRDHSGKISSGHCSIIRNVIPIRSRIRSLLKLIGRYEKGDYHQ